MCRIVWSGLSEHNKIIPSFTFLHPPPPDQYLGPVMGSKFNLYIENVSLELTIDVFYPSHWNQSKG